ncbi:hypothetical protein ACFQQB_32385 [Nonomuraea rubra]|uniref:hypothetical protein n=1 Tax=Nonomuraea rubra TaxID=46180 RepID=UPI003609FD40
MKEIVPQVAGELPAALATELLAATVDWDDAPRDVLARLAGTVPGVLAAVQVGELLAGSAEDVPAERLLPHARWLAGEGRWERCWPPSWRRRPGSGRGGRSRGVSCCARSALAPSPRPHIGH